MSKEKRNKAVILITIDALRADHLKSYGYHRDTAPNLEKFIKNGTTFLNAVTNGPETPTAFSALFTSILPFLVGGYSPLPQQKITLTQILKENGIENYCIHSNPNLGRFFNYDRGYDIFLDGERYKTEPNVPKRLGIRQLLSFYIKKILDYKDLTTKLMYRLKGFNKLKGWLRNKIPLLTEILLPFTPIAYNAPYIVSKSISLLKNFKKPFFFWAHFMDVHSPYNPPTKNVSRFRDNDFSISERDFLIYKLRLHPQDYKITEEHIENLKILYDSEINFIDEHLINFLEFINLQFKKDCLIIITADH
ncbi:MAG: sulfatase-like hydrolase/transferase, partial [Promethearchaeota archaeon]